MVLQQNQFRALLLLSQFLKGVWILFMKISHIVEGLKPEISDFSNPTFNFFYAYIYVYNL